MWLGIICHDERQSIEGSNDHGSITEPREGMPRVRVDTLVKIRMRQNDIRFELPNDHELDCRLDIVLETIYLLFNEGYNATKGNQLIRHGLCLDAVRLAEFIIDNALFRDNSKANALLALMLLNCSRFEARQDEEGNIIEMSKQDRACWNRQLINRGLWHLDQINGSQQVSIYHVLATISAYHCISPTYEETDWRGILSLYDGLLMLDRSPVVLLNRAIAISRVHGNDEAISALLQIETTKVLEDYYPLYSTLAELYIEEMEYERAKDYLMRAAQLTELDSETRLLRTKLDDCETKIREFSQESVPILSTQLL